MTAFEKHDSRAPVAPAASGGPAVSGHVIVCGFAGIAMPVIDGFVSAGERVVLVVRTVDPALGSAVTRWGITVHTAPVGISDALVAAGIADAVAVVCVEENEVHNLETALVAGQLRPDVRVITQLSNATVAGAMDDGSVPGAVLDVADLAAPSVIEACLGLRTHHIDVAGTGFVAQTVTVHRTGTLRDLFGDLAPLAVSTRSSALSDVVLPSTITCPGRDHRVLDGDEVTLLGTPEEFAAQAIPVREDAPTSVARGPSRPQRVRAAIRGFRQDANPNFFRMLGVLFFLLALSTTVLRLGYQKPGMSVLDAIYFSTETVATVGYGDFNFADQPPALRIWSIILMFAGLTTTAMIMAFLAELLISRRIAEAAGRRKARFMTGHVVVIGLGAFGIRVARELRTRGREVVVIERSGSNRFLAAAAKAGIPVVVGDATVPETLADARVHRAAAVAVLTSDDVVNIETGIAVRGALGDRFGDTVDRPGVPVVLRVFDRGMGDAVAQRFGFRHVRSTAELAAPWFIGAALGLRILGTFSVQSSSFMIGRVRIESGGGLVGVEMSDLSADTRVIAILRHETGGLEYPPRRGTRFAAGDDAFVVGPYEQLLAVLEHQRSAAATRP